jgi:hypothetical protein
VFSLESRLRGGAGRIRTLGTGLKPVRADVCVSCAESTSSEILRRLPAPHSRRQTVRFHQASRGEALAIVWLKVVTFKVPQPARLGLRCDCLPSGQS